MDASYVYHASSVPGIKRLTPRKRYVPGVLGNKAKPAVYAAIHPAYAVGHGFSWDSSEGFDIFEKKGKIILEVPLVFKERLNYPVYVYSLPLQSFRVLEKSSPLTSILISYQSVIPVHIKRFATVRKALKFYGGTVKYVSP